MKKTELIIFDMDGLMFDTEIVGMQVMMQVLQEYGYQLTKEMYLSLIGTSGQVAKERLLSYFGEDYPLSSIQQTTRDRLIQTIDQEGLRIKPGLTELIQAARQKNIKICIASSSHQSRVSHYLQLANMEQTFDFVISGDMVKRTKPDPEIFLTALAMADVGKNQALVLEDSKNGILASHAAGIPVICVPDLQQPEPAIESLCWAVLPTLQHVIDYL